VGILLADKLTISVEEAGKALGISRNLAYEMARQGRLPTIRLGRRLLVPVVALERLLAEAGCQGDEGSP